MSVQKISNRLPTVEEARAAVQAPLCESYWWLEGLNFNRPVIATIGVGGHIEHGPFVWMRAGDDCPISGLRAENVAGIAFTLRGPIPLPTELRQDPPQP